MTRYNFGGTAADYVISTGAGGVLRVVPARLTFWSARTGGTQYTDLILNGAGTAVIQVPADGQVPVFSGPDGISELWADAGAGDRVRMITVVGTQGPAGTNGTDGLDGAQGLPGVASAAFQTAHAYTVGSIVQHTDGSWLRCITAHTSGSTIDLSKFEPVSTSTSTVEGAALKANNDAVYVAGQRKVRANNTAQRYDSLRLMPSLARWLNNPVGEAWLLFLGDSTTTSPGTTDGSPLPTTNYPGGSYPSGSDGGSYLRAFDQFALNLAAAYPAINFNLDIWDGANSNLRYQLSRQLSAGSGRSAVALPGSSNQFVTWPLTNATKPTGSHYFFGIGLYSAATWTPGAAQMLISLDNSTGLHGCSLQVTTAGNLLFQGSTNGTTTYNAASTVAVTPPTGAAPIWLAADVDLGVARTVKFYTSSDGHNWTQLGTTVTPNVNLTSIFIPTGPWALGANSNGGGASSNFAATYFEAQVREGGMYGPTILPMAVSAWDWGTGSTVASAWPTGGPTLRIINGCWPGQGLDQFDDPTNLPLMMPHGPYLGVMFNTGHNDQVYFDRRLTDKWDRLLARVQHRAPYADLVIVGQNATQRTDNAALTTDNYMRMSTLAAYAKRKGIGFLDTETVFTDYVKGCAAHTITPTAKKADNATPGDGTITDLIHMSTSQVGVHPAGYGVVLQAQKLFDEVTQA